MTEHSQTAATPQRVELYLRGDTAGLFDAHQQVVNRIERLESNALFSESIVVGGRCIHARAEAARSGALATSKEFQAWARHNGCSLAPAFERRIRTHLGTGRNVKVVVFPAVTLALHDGEDLQAAFPYTDGDYTYTVHEALDAFERGNEDWLTHFDAVPVGRTEPVLEPRDVPAISS